MPIQKLYTNLQGFLGFSCSVCIKRRMQTLVRMKYSRAEHVPKGFMGLRTVETKPKQRYNLSDSSQTKTARSIVLCQLSIM